MRNLFPTLVNNPRLAYLDSAATSQTPYAVVSAMNAYYQEYRSNIHRGIYEISERATSAYEDARAKVADFIKADPSEIIFTKGATEAINLVALGWAGRFLNRGCEIILTELEHHSNIVPWQMLAKRKGLKLIFQKIDQSGRLNENDFTKLLNKQTGLVCVTQVSNALGTINPIKKIIQKAYAVKAKVLIDGSQAIAHIGANMEHLGGPDFYCFSGHKMFGPTGIGVLYAKKHLLEAMEPVFGGGDMILEVTKERSIWNAVPWKFEAGTPPIAEAIGLGAAVDFVREIGLSKIREHEKHLLQYALQKLSALTFIDIYGPCDTETQSGILSFNVKGVHAHDAAAMLDEEHIAVRAGHHCCMPLMRALQVPATLRVSFSIFNTKEEIDRLAAALLKVNEMFNPRAHKTITNPAMQSYDTSPRRHNRSL